MRTCTGSYLVRFVSVSVSELGCGCLSMYHTASLSPWTLPECPPSCLCRALKRLPHSYLTIRMVEGHQCHRVGHAHRKQLLGQRFTAQSPNGRFTDGSISILTPWAMAHLQADGWPSCGLFSPSHQTTHSLQGTAMWLPFHECPRSGR